MDSVDELIKKIGSMKVYDLGQPYWWGMPVHPADPPFQIYLYRYHEHTKKLFEQLSPGFADSISLLITSMHAGTHLDAPVHMSRNLKVLGIDIVEYQQDKGYVNLPENIKSIDRVGPIISRAVMLDIPKLYGKEILDERYEITVSDMENAIKKEGVRIKENDALLIRTGYSRYFREKQDKYLHEFAGIGKEAATWIASKKVSLFGIDNLAAGVPKPFEVHNILLSDNGILMMKSLNLEELSRDEKYICLLIVLPLKIQGGEASLVRPVAIA